MITGNTFLRCGQKEDFRNLPTPDICWTNRECFRYNKARNEACQQQIRIRQEVSSRVFLRINQRNTSQKEDAMKGGTERISRILRQLFNYQRFEKNRALQQMIDYIQTRYTDRGTAGTGGCRTDGSDTGTERN